MKKKQAVTINKNIGDGKPCLTGTRIPVESIFYLNKEARVSPEDIALKHYPQVSLNQIKETLKWKGEI